MATTVMLVGFVNSGIMKPGQTLSVIMGANIGTTVTAWLLTTTDIPDGAGFVLSDLITNYERISDHCSNIAVCVIEIAKDTFETHEYLKNVKSDEGTSFAEMYASYKQKYYIE